MVQHFSWMSFKRATDLLFRMVMQVPGHQEGDSHSLVSYLFLKCYCNFFALLGIEVKVLAYGHAWNWLLENQLVRATVQLR